MLRWKSDESLKVYARLNAHSYADLLADVGNAQIDSVRSQNLPGCGDPAQAAQRVFSSAAALVEAGARADEEGGEDAPPGEGEAGEVDLD